MLTARNWAIGYYIVEYEQNGNDRAEYGSHLLENLSKKIEIKGMDRQMLNTCRIFYLKYPQICDSVSRRLKGVSYYESFNIPIIEKEDLKDNDSKICDSVSRKFEMNPEMLITRLSFTHIRQILPIEDPFN